MDYNLLRSPPLTVMQSGQSWEPLAIRYPKGHGIPSSYTHLIGSDRHVHQARTQGFEKGGYIVEKISIEFLALMLSYSSIMQE